MADRRRDTKVRVVRLAMEGVPPARIRVLLKLRKQSVWRHVHDGEKAGVIARVTGARNPALYGPGPNASALMSGWPGGRPGASAKPQEGVLRDESVMRVHAVNFRVQVLSSPARGSRDLPWRRAKLWGHVPQRMCAIRIDKVGMVRLKFIGSSTLIVYTPSFRAGRADATRMLDVLYLRVQAVLSHLTRTYEYRFGPMRLNQRPEFAFPVDSDAVKDLLARCKPRTAKWWADASPESGGAEIETRDYEEAMKKLEEPVRLARLEALIGKHGEAIRSLQRTTLEQAKNQDQVLRLMETLARQVGELKDIGELQGARTTYLLKELADRLNKRSEGPKET